jgi:hypothetical protein
MAAADCELCRSECILLEGFLANFDMTTEEKAEIQSLLDRAQSKIAV